MRVLVAEDNFMLAEALAAALAQSGYLVDVAPDGLAAEHQMRVMIYDLVILDLQLPELSGFDLLTRRRVDQSRVPILILSAHDGLEERIRGLDLGADDFMGKPFEMAELEARMRALLRRGAATARGLLRSGRLAFDLVDRTAAIDGRPLALPMKELAVLELLLLRAGKVVTKQSLFDRIYDPDEETMLNAIELYVSRLRRKLAPAGLRIRTIRGLGYLLEASPA